MNRRNAFEKHFLRVSQIFTYIVFQTTGVQVIGKILHISGNHLFFQAVPKHIQAPLDYWGKGVPLCAQPLAKRTSAQLHYQQVPQQAGTGVTVRKGAFCLINKITKPVGRFWPIESRKICIECIFHFCLQSSFSSSSRKSISAFSPFISCFSVSSSAKTSPSRPASRSVRIFRIIA